MDAVLKKGVTLLVLVFIGWYVFTNPSGAATSAKGISGAVWSGLQNLFAAVTSFLNALFS